MVIVVSRDVFDPFRYRFGLVDHGGTGRYLFGVRFCDSSQGVWTQQDSLDSPLDPSNANRYAYAGGDPVNNFDPTGRGVEDFVGDLIGAGVSATFAVPFAMMFPEALIPILGVSMIAGCIGNMIGQLATDEMKNEESTVKDIAWKCASGAVTAGFK